MPRKQQKKTAPTPPGKDGIIAAAFRLASVQSWGACTARDIAQEAGIGLDEFYDYFDSPADILVAYDRRLDRAVLEAFPDLDYEASPRDRLFDILMERFDLLKQDREALVSIIDSCKLDPKQIVIHFPHAGQSMTRMLEAAGIDTSGLRGAARVAGLMALYFWTLRVWVKDESEDLSKTMATLDKGLSRLEAAANSLGL